MAEDEINRLEEERKKLEVANAEFKGLLQGLRLTKLNPDVEGFLQLLEWMFKGFRNTKEDMILSFQQLRMTKKLDDLEARIKQLEETLNQLFEWK